MDLIMEALGIYMYISPWLAKGPTKVFCLNMMTMVRVLFCAGKAVCSSPWKWNGHRSHSQKLWQGNKKTTYQHKCLRHSTANYWWLQTTNYTLYTAFWCDSAQKSKIIVKFGAMIRTGPLCLSNSDGVYFVTVHVWSHSEPWPESQFHPGTGPDAGAPLGRRPRRPFHPKPHPLVTVKH